MFTTMYHHLILCFAITMNLDKINSSEITMNSDVGTKAIAPSQGKQTV